MGETIPAVIAREPRRKPKQDSLQCEADSQSGWEKKATKTYVDGVPFSAKNEEREGILSNEIECFFVLRFFDWGRGYGTGKYTGNRKNW